MVQKLTTLLTRWRHAWLPLASIDLRMARASRALAR